jgi:hypothetical protein
MYVFESGTWIHVPGLYCTCSSFFSGSADVSTSTSTSPSSCHLVLSVRQRWRQAWKSMEQLWASPPHYVAFHKCTNSQSCTQHYLCLIVGYPFLYPLVWFGDCCSARLNPCHNSGSQNREPFREIPVKVHIRRPERDSWVYVGRATVSLDTTGHSSQVGESPIFTPFATPDRSSELQFRSCSLDLNG